MIQIISIESRSVKAKSMSWICCTHHIMVTFFFRLLQPTESEHKYFNQSPLQIYLQSTTSPSIIHLRPSSLGDLTAPPL